ncbi:MAG: HNH endonuclease [Paludibacteraceae bacterium]|nr:HNH endonuclease [Paludibacteraceae bacterium]
MNYKKLYDQYSLYVKSTNRKKGLGVYYEKHHVIPKCIGGSDNNENLVLLTAREHFLAHFLLTKIYKNDQIFYKLVKAFNIMNADNQGGNRYFNSRLFEKNKMALSNGMKENNPMFNKDVAKRVSISKIGHGIYDNKSEGERAIIHERLSKAHEGLMDGEKNPMFRKNPFGNKTKEEMEEISRKIREVNINRTEHENREISRKIKESHHNKSEKEKEEIRKKISIGHMGINAWSSLSDEQRLIAKGKLSKINKGSGNGNAKLVRNDDTGEILGCIKEVCNKYNITFYKLKVSCSNGTRINGYKFSLVKKEEIKHEYCNTVS